MSPVSAAEIEGARTAGFVLVGGRSSRMGRDKALLSGSEGATLAESVAVEVLRACGSVALLGDPTRYGHLGLRVVPDLIPGCGPMSGLHAALESIAHTDVEWILLAACDMPNIEAGFLTQLIAAAHQSNVRCVAAETPSGLEPLCAVYHRNTRLEVSKALAEGRLRMRDLLIELGAIGVNASERLVENVNTEHDWHLHLSEKKR